VSRPACVHACGDTTVIWSPATTSRDAATVATYRPCALRHLTRSPCPLQHSIKEARHHFLPRDAKSLPLRSCSICHHALRRCARRAAALSRCCLLVHLHVDVNWGSPQAKPATARSRSDTAGSPLPRQHGPHHGQPSPATLWASHHCRELHICPTLLTGHLVGFLNPLSGLSMPTPNRPRAPPGIAPSVSSHPPRCP
jgi:hypothetical protein